MRPLAAALAVAALAACAAEEEPVANRFARTNAEIENKARAIEAEVENGVRAIEADMQNQIDALANSQASSAAPAEANVAPANTTR